MFLTVEKGEKRKLSIGSQWENVVSIIKCAYLYINMFQNKLDFGLDTVRLEV